MSMTPVVRVPYRFTHLAARIAPGMMVFISGCLLAGIAVRESVHSSMAKHSRGYFSPRTGMGTARSLVVRSTGTMTAITGTGDPCSFFPNIKKSVASFPASVTLFT